MLLLLAKLSNEHGEVVGSSIAHLARQVRLSSVQARRVVHKLLDSQFLLTANDIPGATRQYRINLQKLQDGVQSPPGGSSAPPIIEERHTITSDSTPLADVAYCCADESTSPSSAHVPPRADAFGVNNLKQQTTNRISVSNHEIFVLPDTPRCRRDFSASLNQAEAANLIFPCKTEPAEKHQLLRILANCPTDERQAVLDEIEGASRRNTLRSGIVPFGRYLVSAVVNGTFNPNLGVGALAAREAQAAQIQRQVASSRVVLHSPSWNGSISLGCTPCCFAAEA